MFGVCIFGFEFGMGRWFVVVGLRQRVWGLWWWVCGGGLLVVGSWWWASGGGFVVVVLVAVLCLWWWWVCWFLGLLVSWFVCLFVGGGVLRRIH